MRTAAQRIADARARLAGDADVWVATGDRRGVAHLVPLSSCWHEGEVVVATEARSRTARNAATSGQARLALGSTRDVVSIEVRVELVERSAADEALVTAYRDRTGWSPGDDGGAWVFLRCRPVSVLVWRNLEEIDGRVVMRKGAWLEEPVATNAGEVQDG